MPAKSQSQLPPEGDPAWEWQTGLCGTYACALIRAYPWLRLGVAGTRMREGEGLQEGEDWWAHHFFAHDQEYAYDSFGRHPLPYQGEPEWDVTLLNQEAGEWRLPEEESGPEAAEYHLSRAWRHASSIGLIRELNRLPHLAD